ncbi:NAD(P)H-hydrate dehydratase [Agromyces sp. SYSU K20354]|uniref:ADP-dependent NAD(P)H-hydrate dehydratase n=1 Tax=Agromyces cavernae TaxID=2898659 RepID=UPI001E29EC91|nr:ADP/ATP-dependent (S)-NAD(P)H-hydrate dehydratase [Agromyces cavernae]MCD2443988.1 NAD(P)H-hydrate dehydratase [Agromyces cavernae]
MSVSWREWTAAECVEWVAPPSPDDDKYSRGVLGVITGSPDYPGAAVLGVEAAWRAGAGMVRYSGPRPVRTAVLAQRPETVTVAGRVQGWLVGSGIDPRRRSFVLQGDLQRALASRVPVVLDAGGLDLVGTHTAPTVITPHARELANLLTAREVDASVAEVRAEPAVWAERAARELGVAVLLKGAVTRIVDPDRDAYVVTAPTHRLATAGSGDILGGILGALVATNHDALAVDAEVLSKLAATAAWVHGEAARRASAAVGGGPIVALDIAAALPGVIGSLLAR